MRSMRRPGRAVIGMVIPLSIGMLSAGCQGPSSNGGGATVETPPRALVEKNGPPVQPGAGGGPPNYQNYHPRPK